MIIVEVSLKSAITGETKRLAISTISNIGGTSARRNYECKAYRKDAKVIGTDKFVTREGIVLDHASEAEPVMNLVFKALRAMGYSDDKPEKMPPELKYSKA